MLRIRQADWLHGLWKLPLVKTVPHRKALNGIEEDVDLPTRSERGHHTVAEGEEPC